MIVVGSVGMVYSAVLVAGRWGVPRPLVGLLLLATLTSLPNAYTAIRLGLAGRGAALVSEALNSNTINLSIGILVPSVVVSAASGGHGFALDYIWMVAVTVATLAPGGAAGRRRPAGRGGDRRPPTSPTWRCGSRRPRDRDSDVEAAGRILDGRLRRPAVA